MTGALTRLRSPLRARAIGALAALTLGLQLLAGALAPSPETAGPDAPAAAAGLRLALGDAVAICEPAAPDDVSPARGAHPHACGDCPLCAAAAMAMDLDAVDRAMGLVGPPPVATLPASRATRDADAPFRQRRQTPRGPPSAA